MKDHGRNCHGYPCTCVPVVITKRPVHGGKAPRYHVPPVEIPSTIPAQKEARERRNEWYREGFLAGWVVGMCGGAIGTIIVFANGIRWWGW